MTVRYQEEKIRFALESVFSHVDADADILLLQMPVCSIERPCLALSILKAELGAHGMKASPIYANIAFASLLGIHDTHIVVSRPFPLADWLFARAAFKDDAPDEEKTLEHLAAMYEGSGPDSYDDIRLWLRELRRLSEAFIALLAEKICAGTAKIVACTSLFHQHIASLALLRTVKDHKPQLYTVLGGSNCDEEMGLETRRTSPFIDLVVSGEGEVAFPKLAEDILRSDAEYEKKLVSSPLIDNFDATQFPDHDDYFRVANDPALREIMRHVNQGMPVETSRGCWWGVKRQCTFCGLHGRGLKYRCKSADRVLNELSFLAERHEIRSFYCVDNMLSMRFFKDVFPRLIHIGKPYHMFYETKANLSRQQVRMLADAGVVAMQPGIESLDDRVLKLMNKGVSAMQNIALLKWATESGIRAIWNILYGFPGEDDAWYRNMAALLPLLVHFSPPMSCSEIKYQRFSVYHTNPDHYGLRLKPHRYYALVYPDNVDTTRMAYRFEDYNTIMLEVLGLSPHRPWLELMKTAVKDWTARAASRDSPPTLLQKKEGNDLVILDARTEQSKKIVLEGLHALVLDAAQEITTRKNSSRLFQTKDMLIWTNWTTSLTILKQTDC